MGIVPAITVTGATQKGITILVLQTQPVLIKLFAAPYLHQCTSLYVAHTHFAIIIVTAKQRIACPVDVQEPERLGTMPH
jgi:hypothetical protein